MSRSGTYRPTPFVSSGIQLSAAAAYKDDYRQRLDDALASLAAASASSANDSSPEGAESAEARRTQSADASSSPSRTEPAAFDSEAAAAVLAEAASLAESGTNWRESDQRFKQLDKQLRDIGVGGTAPERRQFVDSYRQFKDRRREAREQVEADRSKAREALSNLAREAEQLAQVTPADGELDAHRTAVRNLQERWRKLGGNGGGDARVTRGLRRGDRRVPGRPFARPTKHVTGNVSIMCQQQRP